MKEDLTPEEAETLRKAAAELALRDFDGTLARLADPRASHLPGELRMLSSASPEEVGRFVAFMAEVAPDQRRRMLQALVDFGETDFQSDFVPLMRALLDDTDPELRALAIDGLWESRELSLGDRFGRMLREDSVDAVRARAAQALGSFVEQSELKVHLRERMAPTLAHLIELAGDLREDPEVRRRALASAGYAEHPDLIGLIESALEDDAPEVRAGALRAMGNSADPRWADEILAWLDEPEPELRFEAVRASGELAIASAVNPLSIIARYETDRLIRAEAIWALGEIGGAVARRTLEAVGAELAGVDEDLLEAVEDAISSCALIEGDLSFASWERPDDEDDAAEVDDDYDELDDYMDLEDADDEDLDDGAGSRRGRRGG